MTAKNVTVSLPEELIEKIKEYARDKDIPSINAGVREALEAYVTRIEKEKLRNEMIKASKDPLFMRDLNESIEAFEASDAEIERGLKND